MADRHFQTVILFRHLQDKNDFIISLELTRLKKKNVSFIDPFALTCIHI